MGLMICIIASKLQTGKAEGPRNLPIVYREKGTRNPKAKKDLRSCAPNTKREVAVPSVHLLLTAPHPVGQADSLSYSICTVIIRIIIVLRGSNEINIVKKRCD